MRPDDAEGLLLAARIARRQGAWNEAEALLDRRVELHGEDETSALERLMLRATRGEVEDVRPLLQLRIDEGGTTADLAREALIEGFLHSFFTSRAHEAIEQSLEKDPSNITALRLLGKMHEYSEQPIEALPLIAESSNSIRKAMRVACD